MSCVSQTEVDDAQAMKHMASMLLLLVRLDNSLRQVAAFFARGDFKTATLTLDDCVRHFCRIL